MIGGVSEFDHGPNSGWKYTINGVNGDGVNIQSASAGDRIKFYYVIDYEKDNRGGGNSAVIGGGSSGGSSVTSETHHKEVLKTLEKDGGTKISNSNANLFKKAVVDSLDEMLAKATASGSTPNINDVDFMAKTATELMAYEGSVYSATVSARQFIEQFDELAEVTTDENLKASLEKQKNEIAKSLVERATTVFVSTKDSELKPGYLELDVEDALDEIIESYEKNVEKVEKALTKAGLGQDLLAKKAVTLSIENNQNGYGMNFNENAVEALKAFAPDTINMKTDKATIKIDASLVSDAESSFAIKVKEEQKSKAPGEDEDKEPVFEFYIEKNGKNVSNFNVPMTIIIPIENKSDVLRTVYYIKPDGTREVVGGDISEDGKSMTFKTNHFSKFTVDTLEVAFEDIDGHPFKEEIEKAVCRGILSGRDSSTFDPESTVTRAEFVMMLQNLTKYPSSAIDIAFADVKSDDWFHGAVRMASQKGFMSGKGSDSFDPYGILTTEEIAVVVSKVMERYGYSGYTLASILSANDYSEVSTWALPGLSKVMEYGVIQLDESNSIKPQQEVSRAQAARILNRLYTLMK